METSLFGDTESEISIAHDNTKNTLKALKKVPSRSKNHQIQLNLHLFQSQ